MNSILDILYEALEPVKDTPGELKAIQDLDQACQVLPEPERDKVWGAAMHLCGENDRSGFLRGIKAGIRLVVEGLGPADFTRG